MPSEEEARLTILRDLKGTLSGVNSGLQEARRELSATSEGLSSARERIQENRERIHENHDQLRENDVRIRRLEQRVASMESEGKARSGSFATVLSVVGALTAIAAVVVSLVT